MEYSKPEQFRNNNSNNYNNITMEAKAIRKMKIWAILYFNANLSKTNNNNNNNNNNNTYVAYSSQGCHTGQIDFGN